MPTEVTSKQCNHPENRRGFDSGIEWCIDCQAIMDEKGNFIPYNSVQILTASAKCPLCGHEGPHPHTPLEQGIYRNGVKAGRSGHETTVRHDVTCNYPRGPLYGPGCICMVVNKHIFARMEAQLASASAEKASAPRVCNCKPSEVRDMGGGITQGTVYAPDQNCPIHGGLQMILRNAENGTVKP